MDLTRPAVGLNPGAEATRFLRFGMVDVLLCATMTLVAAALRRPLLQLVPRFTDETEDMQFALHIVRDGLRPLVSNDTYNGPLFHYLLAAGFAAGAGVEWPREVALLAGSLTVGATYFLGLGVADLALPAAARVAAGAPPANQERAERLRARAVRAAAATSALLMATAFIPIVVNSHIAWSNSTTPLWTTAYLVALVEAARRGRPQILVAAGLLAGLAQQTHPSALAIVVGGAVWIALSRRAWLRTRWPWIGALVAFLCVSNLIWFNFTTPGGSLEMVEERDYAFTGIATGTELSDNARGFARLGYQLVGSSFIASIDETEDPIRLRGLLLQPFALIAGGAAVAGVVFAARRAGVAAAVWVAAALLIPLVNQAYHHYILARYLSPLLPPTFASIGALIGAGMLAGTAGKRPLAGLASASLGAVLVVVPLFKVNDYYASQLAEGKTNERLWQLLRALESRSPTDEPVLLDRALRHTRLTAGGNLLNVPDGLLDVAGIPNDKVKETEQADLAVGSLILLSDEQRDAIGPAVRLETVRLAGTPAPASPGAYGLYRVLGAAP